MNEDFWDDAVWEHGTDEELERHLTNYQSAIEEMGL